MRQNESFYYNCGYKDYCLFGPRVPSEWVVYDIDRANRYPATWAKYRAGRHEAARTYPME